MAPWWSPSWTRVARSIKRLKLPWQPLDWAWPFHAWDHWHGNALGLWGCVGMLWAAWGGAAWECLGLSHGGGYSGEKMHGHGVLVWSGEAGLKGQVGWKVGSLRRLGRLAGDSVSIGVSGLGTACATQAKKKAAETWPLLPLWGLVWTWPCFWPPVPEFHCSHNFIAALQKTLFVHPINHETSNPKP